MRIWKITFNEKKKEKINKNRKISNQRNGFYEKISAIFNVTDSTKRFRQSSPVPRLSNTIGDLTIRGEGQDLSKLIKTATARHPTVDRTA